MARHKIDEVYRMLFFNDAVAWLLIPVNISNRNKYSTLLYKTCHQIRLLYFSILLSKVVSSAMYYDDYFDSFSITSTSKAPEYPLWIPRCFCNIELFLPHRLASSHMSFILQFQIAILSYTCKMSYEKYLPGV